MTVAHQPDTIDNTGTSDVADALSKWIATDGPRLVSGDALAPVGTFRVDYGVQVGARTYTLPSGLTLDLGRATFIQPDPFIQFVSAAGLPVSWSWTLRDGLDATRLHYGTPIVHLNRLTDLTVLDGMLQGGNPHGRGALRQIVATNGDAEGWPGILVSNCTNVCVDGTIIRATISDFVSLGANNTDITLANVECETNGRHAIAVRECYRLRVVHSHFRDIRRMFFDHEPAQGEGLTDLEIGWCGGESGNIRCSFMQLAPLAHTTLKNIYVHDHTLDKGHFYTRIGSGGMQGDPTTGERCNLRFENLVSNDPTPQKLAVNDALINLGTPASDAGWDNITINNVQDHLTQGELDNGRAIYVTPHATNTNVDLSGVTAA